MSSQKTLPVAPSKSKPKNGSPLIKYYLLTYNILSALGWTYVLLLALVHLFDLDKSTSTSPPVTTATASSTLSRVISSIPFVKSSGYIPNLTVESRLPPYLQPVYRRATTTYARIGTQVAFVQSFAILEVFHVLAGWIRSPLQTTAIQVYSRLFLVWGIAEQFVVARTSPLYASMVLAWSATEVVRYSFYAASLLQYEPRFLLHLRYTTFYVLYPLGASSEAFLIYATLPLFSSIPSWKFWAHGAWELTDYIRAVLFVIWWPGLYVMYTHMIAQRRKALGTGTGHKLSNDKGVKAN